MIQCYGSYSTRNNQPKVVMALLFYGPIDSRGRIGCHIVVHAEAGPYYGNGVHGPLPWPYKIVGDPRPYKIVGP